MHNSNKVILQFQNIYLQNEERKLLLIKLILLSVHKKSKFTNFTNNIFTYKHHLEFNTYMFDSSKIKYVYKTIVGIFWNKQDKCCYYSEYSITKDRVYLFTTHAVLSQGIVLLLFYYFLAIVHLWETMIS